MLGFSAHLRSSKWGKINYHSSKKIRGSVFYLRSYTGSVKLSVLYQYENEWLFLEILEQCSAIGFICDNCGRSYSTKCNLQRHKRNECSGLKGFSCEICFKSFTRLHSVKYHKRVYHDSGWIMVFVISYIYVIWC